MGIDYFLSWIDHGIDCGIDFLVLIMLGFFVDFLGSHLQPLELLKKVKKLTNCPQSQIHTIYSQSVKCLICKYIVYKHVFWKSKQIHRLAFEKTLKSLWKGFHKSLWKGFHKSFWKGFHKSFWKGFHKSLWKGFHKSLWKGFHKSLWKGFHKSLWKGFHKSLWKGFHKSLWKGFHNSLWKVLCTKVFSKSLWKGFSQICTKIFVKRFCALAKASLWQSARKHVR